MGLAGFYPDPQGQCPQRWYCQGTGTEELKAGKPKEQAGVLFGFELRTGPAASGSSGRRCPVAAVGASVEESSGGAIPKALLRWPVRGSCVGDANAICSIRSVLGERVQAPARSDPPSANLMNAAGSEGMRVAGGEVPSYGSLRSKPEDGRNARCAL
jgi:hypothetical protein